MNVAELPRRTAHALHALIVTTRELGMPPTAAEVLIYDEESFSARQTARALREAGRLRLAVYVPPRYWAATNVTMEHATELEDRYLRETDTGTCA